MEKFGVIGLGLIGGSIFKDLKSLGYDVIAVSKSQNGENIFKNYDALKDRDIVFVCTPMNKTLAVLDELEGILSADTVVTDVCSLKEFVCKKERPYCFIPSHPMAGTEHKGFENSFEGLFKNAKWVLTPYFSTEAESSNFKRVDGLVEIIKKLGATPLFTTSKKHDEAAAMISHMPMLIAQALFQAASNNPLALEMAASGFRDMTRLALSNEEMAVDMISMNSENIEQAILKLYKSVGDLTGGNYPEMISEIKAKRSKMFTK